MCCRKAIQNIHMKIIILNIICMLFSVIVQAQAVKYNSSNGIAINGYDPVAYFLQNKAEEGKKELSIEWSGSSWQFSSVANLDSFKLQPLKYAPQYGGYCAYGLSENHLAETDPTAWTIVADKLYLNYNNKVKEMWRKTKENRIIKADANWPTITK